MPAGGGISAVGQMPVNEKIIDDHLAVQAIIRSYQVKKPIAYQTSLKQQFFSTFKKLLNETIIYG